MRSTRGIDEAHGTREQVMADSERPGPDNPIRVFLLDDHEVVRRGVRDLLNDESDIDVIGEAGTVPGCSPSRAWNAVSRPRSSPLRSRTGRGRTGADLPRPAPPPAGAAPERR